jgi:hypothetical protein
MLDSERFGRGSESVPELQSPVPQKLMMGGIGSEPDTAHAQNSVGSGGPTELEKWEAVEDLLPA